MSQQHQKEVKMLNEYILALERQIKSYETERQSLMQQVTKTQEVFSKSDDQLRNLKSQLRQLNAVLYRQTVDKTNLENHLKFLTQQNQKLKKQSEIRQQKLIQLNQAVYQKTDLLAKQKNNIYIVTTFHTKQLTQMEQKVKQLQKSITDTMQEKIFLNLKLQQTEDQLLKKTNQNQAMIEKLQLRAKQVEALEFRLDVFEKDLIEIRQVKEITGKKLTWAEEEIANKKKQVEGLNQRLLSGNQSSEQTKKSYQSLIQNIKNTYELEIEQLKKERQTGANEIYRLKAQITQNTALIDQLNGQIGENKDQIDTQNEQITQQMDQITFFKEQVALLNNNIATQKQQATQQKAHIVQNQEQITSLKQQLTQHNEKIECLKSQLSEQKSHFVQEFQKSTQYSRQVIDLSSTISKLKQQMSEQILNKNSSLEDKEKQYSDLFNKNKLLEQQLEFTKKQSQISIDALNQKYQSLQVQTKEEINKKDKQIQELKDQSSSRFLQASQVQSQLSFTQNSLKQTTTQLNDRILQHEKTLKQLQAKSTESQKLNLKISELYSQIAQLKDELNQTQQERSGQSKKLRSKIQAIDQELVQYRKKEAKLLKQLKQSEEKLSKTIEEFSQFKQANEKKILQVKKKLSDTQKELQKTKQVLQNKEQSILGIGSQTEFKIKQYINREQQNNKKYTELEAKYTKLKAKFAQLQKQLTHKDTDHNKQLEKLIVEHKNELKEIKNKSEELGKTIQNKFNEEISALNSKFEKKQKELKQVENELNSIKENTQHQLSTNLSGLQKKYSIIQIQLQDTKKQLNSSYQNLSALENLLKRMKEQSLEKDIKVESLNTQLQKARKDNIWLINEGDVLKAQIQALENSTLYLKKQIASTLDQQQKSLQQIRSLKESNRQMNKMFSSGVAPRGSRASHEKSQKGVLDGTKSAFYIDSTIRKNETYGQYAGNSMVERRLQGSTYKKNTRIMERYCNTQSLPCSDNAQKISNNKDMESNKYTFQEPEFMPPAISSSSYYSQVEQKQQQSP